MDAFLQFRPDVLMLDLIMPKVDGIDVLNEVLMVDPDVRVVLVSGFGDSYLRLGQSLSAFHRSGRVRTLRKPFRNAELRELLMEASRSDWEKVSADAA